MSTDVRYFVSADSGVPEGTLDVLSAAFHTHLSSDDLAPPSHKPVHAYMCADMHTINPNPLTHFHFRRFSKGKTS